MTTPLATSLYNWLLFLHITAAMIWVGGLVTLSVLAGHTLRSGETDAITRFAKGLRVVGPLTLAPATVAVLALGIGLVFDSDAWHFGQRWLVLALALFALAFLLGAAFQSRAAIRAQRAAETGDQDEAANQLRRWTWGMRLILLLLLIVTWDMVAKPGL
jgi:uncharacterized membrane protein